LEPGAVGIRGQRIAFVGSPAAVPGGARREIDCTGKAVLPGFVDCHTHLFQGLARGIGDGMSLWPWLCDFMWPYSAAITAAEAVAAARLGSVEAVRAGITTVMDNHYSPADLETTMAVAEAIEGVGLRGIVARGIFGALTPVAKEHGLAESLFRFDDREDVAITREAMARRPPGSHVAVWPAPINVIYNSQEVVQACVELARDLGTGWHTHCSEAKADPSRGGGAGAGDAGGSEIPGDRRRGPRRGQARGCRRGRPRAAAPHPAQPNGRHARLLGPGLGRRHDHRRWRGGLRGRTVHQRR